MKKFFIIGICIIVLYLLFSQKKKTNQYLLQNPEESISPTNISKEIIQSSPNTTFTGQYTSLPDVYNDQVTFRTKDKLFLPELDFMKKILEASYRKGWKGNDTDRLPATINDITQSDIDRYKSTLKNGDEIITMPADYVQYYTGTTSEKEILGIIASARNEYINYLKSKGIAQKYISEFETNTFPADSNRIHYYPEYDANAPTSETRAYRENETVVNGDFSRLEYLLYAIDPYNHARLYTEAGLLGGLPNDSVKKAEYIKLVRDMGVRWITYHEMTHVLQRAVDTVNSPEKYKHDKVAWNFASKSLVTIGKQNFKNWGSKTHNDTSNREIAMESQADGVAYEVFTHVYRFSTVQKQLVYEFEVNRLHDAAKMYDEIFDIFNRNYPTYNPQDFPYKISDSVVSSLTMSGEPHTSLYRLVKKMYGLGPYGGYLHPLSESELVEFWNFLKS